jgi:hypothetical protein
VDGRVEVRRHIGHLWVVWLHILELFWWFGKLVF